MWREDGVLLMRGRTRGYAVEPRGEYVVGVIERGPMRARRDRDALRLRAPATCACGTRRRRHRGTGDWVAWLAVLEEPGPLAGREFPDPSDDARRPTDADRAGCTTSPARARRSRRDDPALQRALDYLGDHLPHARRAGRTSPPRPGPTSSG